MKSKQYLYAGTLALAVAVVALIVAIKAINQVALLRARLELFETLRQAAAATPAAPPPLPRHEAPAAPSITEEIRTETVDAAMTVPMP